MTSRAPNGSITASVSYPEREMAVALETWLDLIDREYLRPFICEGGSAVKFVEGDAGQLDEVGGRLASLAERNGLMSSRIDASATLAATFGAARRPAAIRRAATRAPRLRRRSRHRPARWFGRIVLAAMRRSNQTASNFIRCGSELLPRVTHPISAAGVLSPSVGRAVVRLPVVRMHHHVGA
jgi:hypothetical protein